MGTWYVAGISYSDELYHHGIIGQKWGVRRFQNSDGTLTEAGKARYSSDKEQKKLSDKLTKNIGSYGSYKRMTNSNLIAMKPQVKHAINSLKDKAKETTELIKEFSYKENEFYNDKKTYRKYLKKVVDQDYEEFGKRYGETKESMLKDFEEYPELFGKERALELYMESTEPKAKELVRIKEAETKSYNDVIDSAKNYADEFLGAYGDKTVKDSTVMGLSSTARERLSKIISDEAYNQAMTVSDRLAFSKQRNY